VSRLRKKIERNPGDPKIIQTVWGGGYVFTPPVIRE
jgi:two-component system OmpR family response regulator